MRGIGENLHPYRCYFLYVGTLVYVKGVDKIFQFHLLKFSGPEEKITRTYFISECFADLSYAKR